MTPRILLVDDDAELLELFRDYLDRDGFAVDCAGDGREGVGAALSGRHDIVVLDVMMPGIGGLEALGQIRASSAIPVVMLTARGDDIDRITGLEQGADDYVPKPCTPRELAARLRAILKRVGAREASPAAAHDPPLAAGTLVLWPAQRRAEDSGKPLALTSSEFSLLEVLARHVGRPVSRAELSAEALGRTLARFDRSIDVHVCSIRHKLGPLPDGRPRIHTVFRKGYLLAVE
jgi:two-component system, OmpR family, response regulator